MPSIKQLVGDQKYEQMRNALRSVFPDEKTVVSDAAVDAAFQVAKHDWKAPELDNVAIPAPVAPAVSAGTPFQYYEALANHTRVAAPHSIFTGHLPLVRFRIPDHGTTQDLPVIHTPAGDLHPVDRLNPSIDVLWATYGADPLLKFGRPERVDMITPPRVNNARFAAISLYLCYAKQTDPGPSFYVLEAGLATGQPRMPFLGRSMNAPLLAQTQYKPTVFSEKHHFYRGELFMSAQDPGEPDQLVVKVFERQPPADQYLEVTVTYKKRTAPLVKDPFGLTVIAGARIQAVADALGVPSGVDQQWFLKLMNAVALNALFSKAPEKQP